MKFFETTEYIETGERICLGGYDFVIYTIPDSEDEFGWALSGEVLKGENCYFDSYLDCLEGIQIWAKNNDATAGNVWTWEIDDTGWDTYWVGKIGSTDHEDGFILKEKEHAVKLTELLNKLTAEVDNLNRAK